MAPPWRDRVSQPAKFRGVEFRVDTSELEGGRKVISHEYPLRDEPFVEDLGRRGRIFRVHAYVVGPDYLTKRDALLEALEEGGPGTLEHPYYGTRTVAVGDYHVREHKDEGGAAFFTVDFIETESRPFVPYANLVHGDLAAAAADRVLENATLVYSGRFTLTHPTAPGVAPRKLPSFTFASITGIVESATSALRTHLAPIIAGVENVASFRRQLDALVLDATNLVRTPIALATRFGDVLRAFVRVPATPRLGVDRLLQAYRFTPSVARPPALTATRRAEQANYDATLAFIRTGIATQAARLAAGAPVSAYESYQQAVAVRDAVLAVLDEQAEAAEDDAYDALVQLRAEVCRALPGETRNLPQLIAYTPAVTEPSLVLAYRLYGSTVREGDLVARNQVRHPGFVVGGRELQVLSRG